jgi:16S rRNA (guanine(1405)-N(7))-methyltransferase
LETSEVNQVIAAVRSGKGYGSMDPGLVERITRQEIAKGRGFKATVKAVRSVLHQVGGAYLPATPPYAGWLEELKGLPHDPADPVLRAFCREKMQYHASTRERLPVIETFYQQTLGGLGEVESLLDLACGLNPLALPWMPLKPGAQVILCDIFSDMLAFVDAFRIHMGLDGVGFVCDLVEQVPDNPVQAALLLKTIPCLEQLQKGIGSRLLEGINAETLVVTYPAASLGGRNKGMRKTYTDQFAELIEGKPWHVRGLEIGSELVYIVRK